MSAKAKSRLTILKWLIILMILCLFNIPLPVSVNRKALIVTQSDKNTTTSCVLRMKGYYHINLFTADKFTGGMSISTLDEPALPDTFTFPLAMKENDGSHIEYSSINGKSYSPGYAFGDFYAGRFFKDIIILIYEHPENDSSSASFDERTGKFLVANVTSYEEAYKKLNKYVLEK